MHPTNPSADMSPGLKWVRQFWPIVLACLVLVGGLTVTAVLWHQVRLDAKRWVQKEFDHHASDIQSSMAQHLAARASVLKGFAALFDASDQVTRQEFHAFFASVSAAPSEWGPVGVAFVEQVSAKDLDSHIAAMRREGLPDYFVRPDTPREIYSPIVYFEPPAPEHRKMLGFDPYTLPTEQAAMASARDNAVVTMSSGRLRMDDAGRPVSGFVIHQPVYRHGAVMGTPAQRRDQLWGWVRAPFRMADFVARALPKDTTGLGLDIYDGDTPSQASLMFSSEGLRGVHGTSPFKSVRSLVFGEHTWTLSFHSPQGYGAPNLTQKPQMVFVAGVSLSIVLSLLTASIGLAVRRRDITLLERNQALEQSALAARHALSELEQQKRVLDHHAIVTITDSKGVILYGNDKFTDISGYTPAEFLGQTHHLVHSGYHPPGFFKGMFDATHQGGDWHATVCNRAKDGHLFWVDTTVLATTDEEGASPRYIAVRTDVTKRQQLEDQLQTSREHYMTLIDNLNDVFFTITPDGFFEYVSPQWTSLMGHEVSEVMGQYFAVFVHPDDVAHCLTSLQRILEANTRLSHVEYRVRRKDGNYVWLSANGSRIQDPSTGLFKLIGMARDIHQNKLDHQALLMSLSLITATFEAIHSGILLLDNDGRITHYNQRLAQLWHLPQELLDAPHSNALLVFAATQVQQPDPFLASMQAMRDRPNAKSDDTFLLADGRVFRRMSHPQIMDGSVVGRVWSFEDISEIKHAEKAALAANRSKSEFLANMSHEIRTPMNGVIGILDLMQQTELNHEQQRMLATVHHSSLALLSILNDILDYSKIESGKLVVERIATPLHEVAQDVVQLMTGMAAAKSIDLSMWIAPELPQWIYSDPIRLRQVLINLIGNAIKFTRNRADCPGRVALRVEACTPDGGHPCIHLRVIDNGEGMREEVVQRLFQPFTQADASTSRKYGGTGLGLSISTQLIKLMGGQIRVQSKMFEGSEFTVELPLLESPPGQPLVVPDRRLRPRRPAPSVAQAEANGQLILIADDNETNRDVMAAQLRLLGYAALVVEDGVTALEQWRTGRFALLMTDCNMPLMSGFDLTDLIRFEEGPNHHTPIIAVSANAMQGEAQRCLDSGMDDYLSKPLRMDELGRMLAKWLPLKASGAFDDKVPFLMAESDSEGEVPETDVPIWKANTLNTLVGNDPEMHRQLLTKFLKNADTQVKALCDAAQVGDQQRMADLAHMLKASARSVGALVLGNLCQQIEEVATAKDSAVSLALTAGLSGTFAPLKSVIQAHLICLDRSKV